VQKIYGLLRKIFLGFLSGFLSGAAAALFLVLLELVTGTREAHREIIWALPIAGFFIGWLFHHFGKDVGAGHNLILDEIHDPKKVVPFKMAPFVLLGTLLTHLFGGSAGREGTAVQMGATLSDQLSRFFKIENNERKILLMAGAGAGFGAAIGAPWAGFIFGMEVIRVGRVKLFAWIECLTASFVGYYTVIFFGAHHSVYPQVTIPNIEFKIVALVFVSGIIFGLASRAFLAMTHFVEKIMKVIAYPPLKPFLAGLILLALYYLEGSYKYVGLGIPTIQESLVYTQGFREPFFKAVYTAITVGSGFKGGEFIPLVFIGTTLGSALGVLLPMAFQLLAALGFAAVFAGASNTPLACSVMAIEIFGIEIAPYALIACFMSYFFSNHSGIYKSQKIDGRKHHYFLNIWYKLKTRIAF
jgi:H+/Cl- antiporter ClcA